MATGMIGKVRRCRKVDPNGNVYYDRTLSDVVFDPIRGVSVMDDINRLRKHMAVCLAFIAENPKGMDGYSAYELAVNNGFEGSIEDWLFSLRGDNGTDGLSAYEIAVVYAGFVGSEEEWIESLRGEPGERGKSAYEVAVDNGYEGTEESWSESFNFDLITTVEIQNIFDKLIAKKHPIIDEEANDEAI